MDKLVETPLVTLHAPAGLSARDPWVKAATHQELLEEVEAADTTAVAQGRLEVGAEGPVFPCIGLLGRGTILAMGTL